MEGLKKKNEKRGTRDRKYKEKEIRGRGRLTTLGEMNGDVEKKQDEENMEEEVALKEAKDCK